MKYILRLSLVLGLITTLAAGAMALTNDVTRDKIAAQVIQATQDALQAVLPAATSFEPQPAVLAEAQATDPSLLDITEFYVAQGSDGPVGIACTMDVGGYGGSIVLMAGIGADGSIAGVKVISAAGETPGLGAKIKDASFQAQFGGKDATAPLVLVKRSATGDSEIQAIAAATISSSAALRAVNSAASLYRTLAAAGGDRLGALKLAAVEALFPAASEIAADTVLVAELVAANPGLAGVSDFYRVSTDGVVSAWAVAASSEGYSGLVTVVVGFDQQSRIVGVVVVDMPGETVGLGSKIAEAEFIGQFAGKPASTLTLTNSSPGAAEIQAVTSATRSSRGALRAVNYAIGLFALAPRN